MRPVGALVNADIEKAVAVIGAFENVKTQGIPGDVADKNETSPVKNLFAIDLDGNRVETISPEGSPERPEVIKIIDVPDTIAADLGDNLAVKTKTGYRGKTPAVGVAQIEGRE